MHPKFNWCVCVSRCSTGTCSASANGERQQRRTAGASSAARKARTRAVKQWTELVEGARVQRRHGGWVTSFCSTRRWVVRYLACRSSAALNCYKSECYCASRASESTHLHLMSALESLAASTTVVVDSSDLQQLQHFGQYARYCHLTS